MRSDLAKVLHRLGGRTLVEWCVDAVTPVVQRTVVVVGHQRDEVAAVLAGTGVRVAVQETQEGTGHAVSCALEAAGVVEEILVVPGDAPFLSTESLHALLESRRSAEVAAAILTFRATDPHGYGRIVRDADGRVAAIVEEAAASEAERAIDEVNSGALAFDAALLGDVLGRLPRRPNGELYLTDAVEVLRGAGHGVGALLVPEREALGINTPEQLAEAEEVLRRG